MEKDDSSCDSLNNSSENNRFPSESQKRRADILLASISFLDYSFRVILSEYTYGG
ncbi:MAG: hypothetical protein ABIJ50_06860 [Pseudomonadota bacterium]